MNDTDTEIDTQDLERRMQGAITALKNEFTGLRTGRASASILDSVMVDAYGSQMPVQQCGSINVPDPRMITVSVWDKGLVGAVERAIRDSGLGLNPVVEGALLRLPLPDLNEERRRELSKMAGQYGETARIAIRNVRKDGMDKLKQIKDNIGEDDQKIWSDEIQELTDTSIKSVDSLVDDKQQEIMKV